MHEEAGQYDASHIQVLEGLEAIRNRPGMYVGSTGVRGLHQVVFEVAGRAVNEVLAGRAGAVDIALTSDGGVRVADDGPGIPVEADADDGSAGLEALLTRPFAWTDLGGRHNAAMSAFGMGPCVTNALSSRLTVEVRRAGVRWVQEYTRGVSPTPPTDTGPGGRKRDHHRLLARPRDLRDDGVLVRRTGPALQGTGPSARGLGHLAP